MSCKLCLHTTYDSVELALVIDDTIRCLQTIAKESASASLICSIDQLLVENKKKLKNIDQLIVNQGPAPFTTLRTIITTANGIAFATGIPMIGVDSLQAFAHACSIKNTRPVVILLNAFNKSVYYAFKYHDQINAETGYAQIIDIGPMINERFKSQFSICGNGVALHADLLKASLQENMIMQEPLKLVPSMEDLLLFAQHNQDKLEQCTSLEPLYLKKSI